MRQWRDNGHESLRDEAFDPRLRHCERPTGAWQSHRLSCYGFIDDTQEGTIRVLRAGGRYLGGREQRLWIGLVTLGAIGLGASVFIALNGSAGFFPPSAAVIAIMAVVVSAGTKVFRRLTSVRNGRLGERLVTYRLHSLSDDYWLVNDVMLPRGRGNVDHVLIGPCGVVVIETKRLAGRIRCDGDEWFVNGRRRGSISRQVNSGATAVRYYLAERHPDLVLTALRWVESIIVFTHPTCRFEVNRARTVVVRYSQLLEAILELAKKPNLSPVVASRLAESLAASQDSRRWALAVTDVRQFLSG